MSLANTVRHLDGKAFQEGSGKSWQRATAGSPPPENPVKSSISFS
jgi:hypothetical protein